VINLNCKKLKVVNLFGGPGSGKSTIRADLFSKMKRMHMDVEETTEFAKDKTWEKNHSALSDQLFILANQNRRLELLKSQVEWAVTDSPIILGLHYKADSYLPKSFTPLVLELWGSYENFNFVIERNHPYQETGRNQTFEEAKVIDTRIVNILDENGIKYKKIVSGEKSAEWILNHILT
jgi:hypothetical protein